MRFKDSGNRDFSMVQKTNLGLLKFETLGVFKPLITTGSINVLKQIVLENHIVNSESLVFKEIAEKDCFIFICFVQYYIIIVLQVRIL